MKNVMHIATNAGHTAQNDGWTVQNDGRTAHNVGRNTLYVCQGPKGWLEEPPRAPEDPPTPILEKTLVAFQKDASLQFWVTAHQSQNKFLRWNPLTDLWKHFFLVFFL